MNENAIADPRLFELNSIVRDMITKLEQRNDTLNANTDKLFRLRNSFYIDRMRDHSNSFKFKLHKLLDRALDEGNFFPRIKSLRLVHDLIEREISIRGRLKAKKCYALAAFICGSWSIVYVDCSKQAVETELKRSYANHFTKILDTYDTQLEMELERLRNQT